MKPPYTVVGSSGALSECVVAPATVAPWPPCKSAAATCGTSSTLSVHKVGDKSLHVKFGSRCQWDYSPRRISLAPSAALPRAWRDEALNFRSPPWLLKNRAWCCRYFTSRGHRIELAPSVALRGYAARINLSMGSSGNVVGLLNWSMVHRCDSAGWTPSPTRSMGSVRVTLWRVGSRATGIPWT